MIANSIAFLSNVITGLPTNIAIILAEGEAAVPAGAGPKQPLTPLQQVLNGPWILIIGLLAIWYITMIAPERRRKAEEAKLYSGLKKNDRVVTIGGIHGTIAAISSDNNVVTLRIDENGNTRIKINRSAIASVVNPNKENKETTDKESSSITKDSL